MSGWIGVALVGYLLAAAVSLADKFLLARKLDPWQYVVYGGLWGVAALVLVPFGFSFPSAGAVLLAVLSGVLFLAGLYPLYILVSREEVSRAAPLIGALVPLFTLLGALVFLGASLSKFEVAGFVLLVMGGGLLIFRRSYLHQSLRNVGTALVAAVLFGLSFVAIKASFNAGAGFITGYVIARTGSFVVVLGGVILFYRRFKALAQRGTTPAPQQAAWVGANKLISGISFLFINYAVFLGSVSIVQALQGVQYVLVLLGAALLGVWLPALRERFSVKITFVKVVAILLIGLGLVFVSLAQRPPANPGEVSTWGATFSTKYAAELGLEYQEAFRAILDDLGVRHVRLIAYWPEIEPERDRYNFEKLDWLVNEVERRGGDIIMTVGRKVPRYPECHIPTWAEESETLQRKELLELIERTVTHYKDSGAISAWQVENEPFLPTTANLGECPPLDTALLDKEIALVRSLDTRPVIVTDSGELGRWLRAYKRADIFGTSLYRVVWVGEPFGYFHHISPPEFYFAKENVAAFLYGIKPVITIELQTEPWGPDQNWRISEEERRESMDITQMRKNISFARRVGHDRVYLWGAEWWYWEKQQGNLQFWEEAQKLWNQEL